MLTERDERDDTVVVGRLAGRDPAQSVGPQNDIITSKVVIVDLDHRHVDLADLDHVGKVLGVVDHELDRGLGVRSLEPAEQ